MKCPRCHLEASTSAAFCDECGARLDIACLVCSKPNRLNAKFCADCGSWLAALPLRSPLGSTAPAFLTPKHLSEGILTSRAALVGERKHVTVMFADIRGSMELIADKDPEEARKVLDPILQLMMDAVHQYEGIVAHLLGDGIMALFGAPIAHEDHAVRAGYAAIQLQQAVTSFATQWSADSGTSVEARVGLNSGEVVVRSLHKNLHSDHLTAGDVEYSAVGDAVHLAARMEQNAKPGTIYLTESTRRAIEGFLEVRFVDELPIKGLRVSIPVYELGRPRQIWGRFQIVALTGTLGQFVGREVETAAMLRTREAVANGHGQILSLVGDPGVGKSRLAYEFGRSSAAQGWVILEAHAVSYGARTAYLPIRPIMKVLTRPWLINSHALVFPMSKRRHMFRTLTASGLPADSASRHEPVLSILMSSSSFARISALGGEDRQHGGRLHMPGKLSVTGRLPCQRAFAV
jgi:class 3 adenylate cyclase